MNVETNCSRLKEHKHVNVYIHLKALDMNDFLGMWTNQRAAVDDVEEEEEDEVITYLLHSFTLTSMRMNVWAVTGQVALNFGAIFRGFKRENPVHGVKLSTDEVAQLRHVF